ncbi:MAG: hypothetical protein CMN54_00110 [SAR324 cluster bacterium]|uniref:Uncharacterized protein n=1 Tax=SAR324 cluster bacterium TaxID=2024889 RepID=A0A2D6YFA2_9DELT|nr:hypothetical protein [SAR324 cluster bacterium]
MLKLLSKHVFLVGIFLILTIHTASAQLLGLALSLGNTLAGYIFDIYLRTENTLDIDGAPDWYSRNDDAEWDCAFSYAPGSLASVEKAKTEATKNLVAQQEQYVQSAIRDEVQRRKPRDEKERQLVEQFRNDPELKNFVTGQRQFLKITYDEDVRAAFVKACLSREIVVAYQKERIQKITTELSKNRAESAFGELEAHLDQPELDLNTPTEFDSAASKSKNAFEELDQEISLPND